MPECVTKHVFDADGVCTACGVSDDEVTDYVAGVFDAAYVGDIEVVWEDDIPELQETA